MSKRESIAVLQDMKESINRIISYTSKMKYDDFLQDYKTQDAVIRNIEILGEAAKLLSDETKEKYPNIPWSDIVGTRDKLIHRLLWCKY
ncbi:MAG: HepT-like ribonuclease domain-containing protein [bacterium]